VRLVVQADPEAVARAAAEHFVARAALAIEGRGRFRVALAGGSTPRLLYRTLATDGFAARVDWPRVDIFFGDERCVAPDDPASNYAMARESLLDRVGLPPANIHRIEGERAAPEAAADYTRRLGPSPLDQVLLGMGDDGHTASLFPATRDLQTESRSVVPTTSPKPPPRRVSLSLAAINRAGAVAFLVTGAGKAARLAQVHAQAASSTPTLPAALVRPTSGDLVWFVDTAAAAQLD